MFVKVGGDGDLSLEEADDFKRFHVSADADTLSDRNVAAKFHEIAEDAGEGHYWLDADAVVELSGRSGDAVWTGAFWAMLEKAEPYGFSDVEGRRIKAHLA